MSKQDAPPPSLPAPVIYALFGLWACFVAGLILYAATHVKNWWPKEKAPDWPAEERRTTGDFRTHPAFRRPLGGEDIAGFGLGSGFGVLSAPSTRTFHSGPDALILGVLRLYAE
jgi:hypothetical protein